jgi:hypothetical protein
MGPADRRADHAPYLALWNMRGSSRQYHLYGPWHRRRPWVEYLRWLQLQSHLFLRLAYTQADIAELPDSDSDNKFVDEYDELTQHGTVQPERVPFQNYMVSIFPYFYYVHVFTLKFIIVTIVVQTTQLGRFTNEAADTLSHLLNSTASHSALRAFTEVSMISIFVLHPNVSLNSLYCYLCLCRGSARVLDSWHFTTTASEPSMWVIPFHHKLPSHIIHRVQTTMEKPLYKFLMCSRRRVTTALTWMRTSTRPCF